MQAVMRMQTVMHHDEDACGDATTRELMAGKLSAVQQLTVLPSESSRGQERG